VEAFCPYVGGEEVSWTGGVNQCGHAAHTGVPAHPGYARWQATSGSRRRAFGRDSSANGAACSRTLSLSSWRGHPD
jgi:hypothetical protein